MADDEPIVDVDPGDEIPARVTPATAADVDAVTDLWVALAEGQRDHGSTLLAEANRATVREWVARSVVTGELLVAREGAGEPVGFVGFAIDHGGYDRDRTRGTVSNLFVAPERRGEGIGRVLLSAAERALAEAGADTVALEALTDNERAREFYAEQGYEPHRVELTKSLSAEDDEVATDRTAAGDVAGDDEAGGDVTEDSEAGGDDRTD